MEDFGPARLPSAPSRIPSIASVVAASHSPKLLLLIVHNGDLDYFATLDAILSSVHTARSPHHLLNLRRIHSTRRISPLYLYDGQLVVCSSTKATLTSSITVVHPGFLYPIPSAPVSFCASPHGRRLYQQISSRLS